MIREPGPPQTQASMHSAASWTVQTGHFQASILLSDQATHAAAVHSLPSVLQSLPRSRLSQHHQLQLCQKMRQLNQAVQAQSRAGMSPCSTITEGDTVAGRLTPALLCSSEGDGQSLQEQALAALLAGKLDAPLFFQAGKASASGWLQKQVKGKGSLLDTTEADFVVPKVTGRHAAIIRTSLGSQSSLTALQVTPVLSYGILLVNIALYAAGITLRFDSSSEDFFYLLVRIAVFCC